MYMSFIPSFRDIVVLNPANLLMLFQWDCFELSNFQADWIKTEGEIGWQICAQNSKFVVQTNYVKLNLEQTILDGSLLYSNIQKSSIRIRTSMWAP